MPSYKSKSAGVVSYQTLQHTGGSGSCSVRTKRDEHHLLTLLTASQDIIAALTGEIYVEKLTLSHGSIGDASCIEIFEFLCHQPDRKYGITEVDLRRCNLGDDGLIAVSRFLKGNHTIRTVLLQAVSYSPHCVVSS